MKLSLNWLGDYVDASGIGIKEYCDRMTMTGNKVEGFELLGGELENVVVGRVIKMSRHENSDHLWVCSLDVGKSESVQIVTGAQNVFEGALVPVALAPAKLPGGVVIKAGKLRVVDSNGMLCSISELGLTAHDMPGAAQDGILILESGLTVGEDIKKALLLSDTVVEFEITSNRPDCLSVIGLARETGASFEKKFVYSAPVVKFSDGDINDYLKVKIEDSDLCARYAARVVKNVKIAPSPLWMRMRLRACGVRPINNIVDITNYVMLEYGQPMHAFDYTCLEGGVINVRRAAKGESFRSLDDIDHILDGDTLVIADGKKPVALAGIMGGANSEIKDDTATVVFESASFNGTSVRITAKKQGMRTESSSRFEKGLDSENVLPALDRACQLVELLCAGEVVKGTVDIYPGKKKTTTIAFAPDTINTFLGTDIPVKEMEKIFSLLEIELKGSLLYIPSWRSDLVHMQDIAEEIARIYGYNNIEATLPTGPMTQGGRSEGQKFEESAHALMCGLGYNEICTFSFISPKYCDKINMPGESPLRRFVVITNPLGEDTSVMRTTALPSMLEVLARNNNFSSENVALYEMAKVYLPDADANKLPDERRSLTIGFYGKGDFYTLKGTVAAVLENARIYNAQYTASADEKAFHPGRCAVVSVGGVKLGVLGEIHPEVAAAYGFEPSKRVYAAELDFENVWSSRGPETGYVPLPKFPASTRDFSFVCAEETEAAEIEKVMRGAGDKLLRALKLFDVYRGPQVGEGKKSVSFRITLRADDRTITDEEADKATSKILRAIEENLGITIRS